MEGGGENLDVTFTGWMVFRFINCHVEVARNDDVTTVGHLQTSVVLFFLGKCLNGVYRDWGKGELALT